MIASGKLNTEHLSEEDCQKVFSVLQRDLQLRTRERNRLRVLEDEILVEQRRRDILTSKQSQITKKYCLECLSQFRILLNSSKKCSYCCENFCKRCCHQQSLKKSPRCCSFCEKTSPEEGTLSSDQPPRAHTSHTQPLVIAHTNTGISNIGPLAESLTDTYSLNGLLKQFTSATHKGGNSDSSQKQESKSFQITRELNKNNNRNSTRQFCSRCGQGLSPLSKRNAQCVICMQWICKSCAMWEVDHNGYICELHVEEEGYRDFNMLNTDWMYDSRSKSFKRTLSGEISATIGHRLNNDLYLDATTLPDSIPSLSVDAFMSSMNGLQSVRSDSASLRSDSASNKLSADTFFQSTEKQGANLLMRGELHSAVQSREANNTQMNSPTDGQPFADVKDAETKRFLIEVDACIKKIRNHLVDNISESDTEDLLSQHRSALSSLIANMEQSLHLAVDNQSPAADKLVRHSEVSSVVCSIVEEYVGESLAHEVLGKDGALNYSEIANHILVKILEDKENEEIDEGNLNFKHGSMSPSLTASSYSDYGSSKLPDFSNSSNMETDPDLLSLGQDSAELDEFYSQEGNKWEDCSSTSDRSNWYFRGKVSEDSLGSTGSSFINHFSSEESVNIIAVPQSNSSAHGSDDSLSDSGSDFTLTSIDLLELSTDSFAMNDIMRIDGDRSGQRGRCVSTSTTNSRASNSEYSEIGEDSKDLSFSTRPKSQKVCQGDVARFTCTVAGITPIDVYWFKEGEEDADALETNDKYEVTLKEGKHSLEIFFASPNDSGQYLCLAKNDSTSSHWMFGLTVDESTSHDQKPPLFLKELSDIEASEGEVVKFRCKVRAYPLPRISWYKDGDRIDSSPHYKLEKFGNRDYTLTINSVTPNHDAEFTVVARNGAGEARSSAQLLVEAESNERAYSRRKESIKSHVSDSQNRRRRHYAAINDHEEEHTIRNPAEKPRKPFSILQANQPILPQVSEVTFSTKGSRSEMTPRKTSLSETSVSTYSLLKSDEQLKSNYLPHNLDGSLPVTPKPPVTPVTPVTPKRSLRAALHSADERSEEVEAANTVTIKPEKTCQQEKPSDMVHMANEERHSSTIELSHLSPAPSLKAVETSTPYHKRDVTTLKSPQLQASEALEAPLNTIPSPISWEKGLIGQRVLSTNTEPLNVSEMGVDIHPERGVDIQPERGVDIQPERGVDIHPERGVDIHPERGVDIQPERGVDIQPERGVDIQPERGVDIQPGFVREKQFQKFGNKITPEKSPCKSPSKHQKGLAPVPPTKAPETIELSGCSQHDDIPIGRSEWSDFFPSVKQRKASFTADDPSTPNTTKSPSVDATRKSKKKTQAPSPPTTDSSEPATKKTVKKMIKRTVKRTTCKTPVSSTEFGEQPPTDGDYIKVCGKWVKMKGPVKQTILPAEDVEPDDIPLSRSEWGPEVSVGQTMKSFKRFHEAEGRIITGRSQGPVTEV